MRFNYILSNSLLAYKIKHLLNVTSLIALTIYCDLFNKCLPFYIFGSVCYFKCMILALYVVFLPCRVSFPQHFLEIVVEVNALEPPHVLKLWLLVSKVMLHVKYFRSIMASFLCQLYFMEII